MAKNRNKKSPRASYKRKRHVAYVDPIYYSHFTEQNTRRHFYQQPPQAICIGSDGAEIPLRRTGWYFPYAWPYEHVSVWYDRFATNFYDPNGWCTPPSPSSEVGADGATYCSPPVTPAAEIRGYVEGYHDLKVKHQTREWWGLFGDTTGEMYVLDGARRNMGVGGEEEVEAKKGEEEGWSAAAYFAPYRTTGTDACAGFVDDKEKSKADGPLCAQEFMTDKEGRGRDEWACDFCGLECFCWTVNGVC